MVYVCLKVMNERFVNRCRPFIRIDDCHLKSSYRGVLLSAVGLDDNNELFSLVYVVVEYESNDTYRLFLYALHGWIKHRIHQRPFCIIYDREKGIYLFYNKYFICIFYNSFDVFIYFYVFFVNKVCLKLWWRFSQRQSTYIIANISIPI